MEIGDNAFEDDCPVAPAYRTTIHSRVLHRACQKLGGVAKLAEHLRVPQASLYRWLDGEEEPPTEIFLKAVDLVMPVWGAEDDVLAREMAASRRRK